MTKLTNCQAQERYLTDVRFAIHFRQGKFHLFERLTGDTIGEYANESDARVRALSLDPKAMIRINYEKIVGGPTIEEIRTWGTTQIRKFLHLHPGHIGAENVLREQEKRTESHSKLCGIQRPTCPIRL